MVVLNYLHLLVHFECTVRSEEIVDHFVLYDLQIVHLNSTTSPLVPVSILAESSSSSVRGNKCYADQ